MSHAEKTLGHYVVESEIGRGGMGVVLLGRHPALDRPAVLKQVRKDLVELPELLERFKREARAAGAIHHHNVVAVYDTFAWRGSQYIAQEYVDGIDLGELLGKSGAMPWRISALVVLEALRGLEEIHARGTVHRDLKPNNVLLGRRGEVKIADFGLALEATSSALTQPGVMLGSLPYMSPEQMLGERADARSDMFSIGVVLYEMLVGSPPFPEPGGEETEPLLKRIQKQRYTALRRQVRSVPRFLARIVRRSLNPHPARRPSSARELRIELEESLRSASAADAREEIASWLWERRVFAARENETMVQVAARPVVPGRRRHWVAAAAALAAGVLLWTLAPRVADEGARRGWAPWLAHLELALPVSGGSRVP